MASKITLKRRANAAAGLCVDCGNPPKDGLKRCESCSQKRKKYTNTAVRKRREQKVCIRCGRKTKKGLVTCANCLAYGKSLKAVRISVGQCKNCDAPAAEGIQECWNCRSVNRVKVMDLLLKEKEKALAAILLFNGPCQCCGRPSPEHKKGWFIDHCHEAKTFRGIICCYCNIMLGGAKDSLRILDAGKTYLIERGYIE